MSNNDLSRTGESANKFPGLGANEQALIDTIAIASLRTVATKIVLLKMRLQFTGWLQYILPAILMLVFFLIAGLASLVGIASVVNLFVFAGFLLLLVFIFDLVTVKFRLRFPEPLPKRNDDLEIFDLMRVRRSCRSFQIRKLRPDDYSELMESVCLHSESSTIGESPIRFEYLSAPLTIWPVVNATEFLVAIVPKEYNRLAIIDVGRSLQKIVMDATSMGLGTCWIGPGADQSSIMKHLGERFNPDEDHIICVCAVGYKSWYMPLLVRIFNAQMGSRLPLSDLFFSDEYFNEPLNVEAYPYNKFGRNYEICQWSPSSYNGQTTRCVAVKEESDGAESRLTGFDFYAATTSRYYAAVAVGIWCANWEMGCEAQDIRGHFTILSNEERAIQDENALPRYDLSWLLEG